jgi:putative endonuclease
MAWVYILRGSSGRHYLGSTNNLARRLTEHQHGGTHTTARLGDTLELVASLELSELTAARAMERELKRKKNPQLAIRILQSRANAPT